MTKISKLLLISSVFFTELNNSFAGEHDDLVKRTEAAYYELAKIEEFKEYKKIRDLFHVCWNGSSIDILTDNTFLSERNVTTMQKFIDPNHPFEKEVLFKKAFIDQILPKLYSLQDSGRYEPTKSLSQICSFFAGCPEIEYNDGSTYQLAMNVTTQRFLFINKNLFFNRSEIQESYENYKNLKYTASETKKNNMKSLMKTVISNPLMLSTLSAHSFISPSVVKDLKKISIKDINNTVNKYRFRYCVLSFCFPEIFLDAFEKKSTQVFKITATYQNVMDTSLILGEFKIKNEQRSVFENILFLNPKTKKYIAKDIRDLNGSDVEFFTKALLKKMHHTNLFNEISRDMLLYSGFEKEDGWYFTPIKKTYDQKAQGLLSLSDNDATKCKTFLQNYYLTNKRMLVNLLSDEKETKDSSIKFTIFDKTPGEEKIKLEMKKFLLKEENLFNIFELSLDQNKLRLFFESLKKIDADILRKLEQKYMYRFLVINDYFPGKLEQKRENLISNLQKKVEEERQKDLERDRLFKELLEDDKKKTTKKKPAKKVQPQKEKKSLAPKKSEPIILKKAEKKEEQKKNNNNKPTPKKAENSKSSKKSKKQNNLSQKSTTQKQSEKKTEIAKNNFINTKDEVAVKNITEEKENNIIIQEVSHQEVEKKEDLVLNNQISSQIASLEDQIMRLESRRNEIDDLILSKKLQCKAVEFGTMTIHQEIERVRYHLVSVQNLKEQERRRFEADLEGLTQFFIKNNPEDIAKRDMDSFIFQANQILTNSYADFYNGVGHMNLMIGEKYKLIEEINKLLTEQSLLQTEIALHNEFSPKENIIQLDIPEKKSEKKSGIFSKIKEKKEVFLEKKNEFVATVKGVASVIKQGDLRNLPIGDLNKRYASILNQKNQLNLQNSQLKKQLEYVNEKLEDLLKENQKAMERLASFQATYSRIMNQFQFESTLNQDKIYNLYQDTLMSIDSSVLKESLISSVKFFQQVNGDASFQMGRLNLDIQNIMHELNSLEVQKNTLFFDNTKLKTKLKKLKESFNS